MSQRKLVYIYVRILNINLNILLNVEDEVCKKFLVSLVRRGGELGSCLCIGVTMWCWYLIFVFGSLFSVVSCFGVEYWIRLTVFVSPIFPVRCGNLFMVYRYWSLMVLYRNLGLSRVFNMWCCNGVIFRLSRILMFPLGRRIKNNSSCRESPDFARDEILWCCYVIFVFGSLFSVCRDLDRVDRFCESDISSQTWSVVLAESFCSL